MSRKIRPTPEALRIARDALDVHPLATDRQVLNAAKIRLGLRRQSDYPHSLSRLLLDAANMRQ